MPCFHHRTRSFPHTTDSCVKLATRSNCVEPHCCECFHRTLGKQAGCFCCITPTPNLLPGVTQLHVPPWCMGIYDGSYQEIYLPKHAPFYPKTLPTPLNRLDFQARDVSLKRGHDGSAPYTVGKGSAKTSPTLEADLKVARKEEALINDATAKKDNVEKFDEIPAKKTKMETTSKDQALQKEDSGKDSSSVNTTQLNTNDFDQKHVPESAKEIPASHAKINQEFSQPQDVKTNNSELCNSEKAEANAMDNQGNLPQTGTRKPHQVKSKKGNKDSTVKPYNTRMATSQPRTYSSDFVIPEEEEDWNQPKEGYHVKGRQRSKLNRLLANEHERRRVAQLNSAYQDLRQLIPGYQCDTKLPKIKILKYAINYIAHLDDILENVQAM